jgi:hypothetical protein
MGGTFAFKRHHHLISSWCVEMLWTFTKIFESLVQIMLLTWQCWIILSCFQIPVTTPKKNYYYAHTIVQTLVPYCIVHKQKLQDRLVVRYFYHFQVMVSTCKNKHFYKSHNNVFVLYTKVVSEMKKINHNLNVQTKFTVYLPPEIKTESVW